MVPLHKFIVESCLDYSNILHTKGKKMVISVHCKVFFGESKMVLLREEQNNAVSCYSEYVCILLSVFRIGCVCSCIIFFPATSQTEINQG